MSDTPLPARFRFRPQVLAGALKRHLLHPELTAHEVSLSFALGFAIAWSPLVGLHTSSILLLCLLFRRLHQPLMILASLANNPWTVVPMATACTVVGSGLLGRGWGLPLGAVPWHTLGWRCFASRTGFLHLAASLKPILAPFLVGGAVLSGLALGVGYGVVLWVTLGLRRSAARPTC